MIAYVYTMENASYCYVSFLKVFSNDTNVITCRTELETGKLQLYGYLDNTLRCIIILYNVCVRYDTFHRIKEIETNGCFPKTAETLSF